MTRKIRSRKEIICLDNATFALKEVMEKHTGDHPGLCIHKEPIIKSMVTRIPGVYYQRYEIEWEDLTVPEELDFDYIWKHWSLITDLLAEKYSMFLIQEARNGFRLGTAFEYDGNSRGLTKVIVGIVRKVNRKANILLEKSEEIRPKNVTTIAAVSGTVHQLGQVEEFEKKLLSKTINSE